jgi:hypothetical protein
VRRFIPLLFLVSLVLAACGGGQATEQPLDPTTLLAQAVTNMQPKNTFRLIVDRTGAIYIFQTDLGPVTFERAEGQYVSPDTIGAKVKVQLGELPIEADIYAVGERQWARGIWTNMEWTYSVVAAGFDPSKIISGDGGGLKTALDSLVDPKLVGEEALEDGTAVYHLSATANGEDVSALVVNLIQMTGTVNVDVYIAKDTGLPLRFIVVQPDTVTEDSPDPTTWTIDLYDFDAPVELEVPDNLDATAEATVDATSEATPADATAEVTAEATPGT